jgi:hypothetical protein
VAFIFFDLDLRSDAISTLRFDLSSASRLANRKRASLSHPHPLQRVLRVRGHAGAGAAGGEGGEQAAGRVNSTNSAIATTKALPL